MFKTTYDVFELVIHFLIVIDNHDMWLLVYSRQQKQQGKPWQKV
jgi:hypothetical protein